MKEHEIQKNRFILHLMGFLMIHLTTLYDEYIDWPKLIEQKHPFEYIVPPPNKVGRNNHNIADKVRKLLSVILIALQRSLQEVL